MDSASDSGDADSGLTELRVRTGTWQGDRRVPLSLFFRYSSRCTFEGENAGTHTAMYSAPSGSGVL
jgi:hypothetical protein